MTTDVLKEPGFSQFSLSPEVLKAVNDAGYEAPSPIQAEIIPYVLEGRDVVGQAHTGTGKTAAFALPLLTRINLKCPTPQVLVLTPTRELAIQVAEAFQSYASHMKRLHVLPIYGGQDYGGQLRQLKRGVHVVVGTPGRVMDHMRRKTLNLESLVCLVLDEADEMLRMGFIDDVKWVLQETPPERQVALFSATMPNPIRKIAKQHLIDPKEVSIKMPTKTAESIRQRYWMVSGFHKLDVLTRILEVEVFEAVLIFVRTKVDTVSLSEKLEARGYASAPLNGDLTQSKREKTVEQLKNGKIDIVVGTDVAARGLDVERISHVINYDIPNDTEVYIHRIGRTGRAGRSGEAILFVSPRERRLLGEIERATKHKIELMKFPSTEVINNTRIARFKQRITDTLALENLDFFSELMEQYRQEHDIPALDIAAALGKLLQGDSPLLLEDKPELRKPMRDKQVWKKEKSFSRRRETSFAPEEGMASYRIEVGHVHGVKPGNIVGAISNEAGLESQFIGKIKISDDFSVISLPDNIPQHIFRKLKTVWVSGAQLNISKLGQQKKDQGFNKRSPFSREKPSKRVFRGKDHPRRTGNR